MKVVYLYFVIDEICVLEKFCQANMAVVYLFTSVNVCLTSSEQFFITRNVITIFIFGLILNSFLHQFIIISFTIIILLNVIRTLTLNNKKKGKVCFLFLAEPFLLFWGSKFQLIALLLYKSCHHNVVIDLSHLLPLRPHT